MKKIGMMVIGAVLWAGSAGAVLLVEETFDYGVGSDSSTWTGGTGFSSSAWSPGTTGTTIDNGLTFGPMAVSGGSAHIQFTADAAFSAGAMGRSLDTTSVTSGDLWMAYLIKFDTERSTIPADEALEIRPGTGDIRTKVDENNSALGIRYGSAYSSATDPSVKDGTTLLFVAKFSDMGAATGESARGWAMTAGEYGAMMMNGGLSEANLDAYAGMQMTKAHEAGVTMSGNVTMQFVPLGRNESTPSFYVDELRMGTELEDVVAVPEPASVTLFVISSASVLLMRRCWK